MLINHTICGGTDMLNVRDGVNNKKLLNWTKKSKERFALSARIIFWLPSFLQFFHVWITDRMSFITISRYILHPSSIPSTTVWIHIYHNYRDAAIGQRRYCPPSTKELLKMECNNAEHLSPRPHSFISYCQLYNVLQHILLSLCLLDLTFSRNNHYMCELWDCIYVRWSCFFSSHTHMQ